VEGHCDPLLDARPAFGTLEAEGGLVHKLLTMKQLHFFHPMQSTLSLTEIEHAINEICLN
jgi:hypothetical protein